LNMGRWRHARLLFFFFSPDSCPFTDGKMVHYPKDRGLFVSSRVKSEEFQNYAETDF
jgi:hypothetical protein